ncbi:MAG: ABC transporter ATP-binding protein [Gammaproteobacteria bacterium]|nr:ABC transporter ATP-binding protein [Gammaproteobacteria bacterium]
MRKPAIIKLRNLTKVYQEGEREHIVLREVNAEFNEGELIVLLGRSGSGKSTLLNLISGIDVPTTGEVIINSTPLTRISEQARTLFRRRHIGFIFQFFNLIPTLTVEENLLLPLELNVRNNAEEVEKALHLLDEIGLRDRAGSYPDRLSGGEQQRVAIARALTHDPLLILADEPTGNLDLETGHDVLDLLDRLTRQAGKTLIMGTHSREVVGIADRILTIRSGQLMEEEATP